MKKWKLLATTAALGALVASPASAATTINYNDVTLNTQQPVYVVENRTMVAMRDLFENLEADVSWDDATRLATLNYRDVNVKMYPDTGAVLVNNVSQALDVRPQLINDRIYLPLRFVAQTLGSTVDYKQLPNGDSFIDIHTMDSVENFVTVQGNVTRVLRTAANPVTSISSGDVTPEQLAEWKNHNQVFFFDDHGSLVELQSVDNKITAYITDLRNAKASKTETGAPTVLTTLTKGAMNGGVYQVVLNAVQDEKYLGMGQPMPQSAITSVEGLNTDVYDLRDGVATGTVLSYDRSNDTMAQGIVKEYGFVLDMDEERVNKGAYAKAKDGSQAFLLDDYLMILDKKGQKLEDAKIRTDNGNAVIYATDDYFLTLHINRSFGYPELFVAEYNRTKETKIATTNISFLTKVADDETFYPYNSLELVDSMLKGDTLYAFIKTDMDYYVITYNYRTKVSNKLMLQNKEHAYIGFVDALDSVKLIGTDNNYYYLRAIH